ncbi:hypothetical protein [Verminephrobacter eiseniae]|nr:hypothetical protein [Verminephrobacter eiseniae]
MDAQPIPISLHGESGGHGIRLDRVPMAAPRAFAVKARTAQQGGWP